MYTLVVSTIHDRAVDSWRDSDGAVHEIADLPTALHAAWTYVTALQEQYGQTWTSTPMNDATPFSMTMWLPATEATVCVEVQKARPKRDAEDIVRLLVLNTRFVRNDNHGQEA